MSALYLKKTWCLNMTMPKPHSATPDWFPQELESATKRLRAVSVPRRPLQKRSRERYEHLLTALDELLSERPLDEVGFYDIAQQAGMPAATVYHFFPAKEAAFAALAERYFERLDELNKTPLPLSDGDGWQEHFRRAMSRSIQYYNDHPVFMSLALGGAISAEVRQRDLEFNDHYVVEAYDRLNNIFVMPYIPDAPLRFHVLLGIFDGMGAASYGRFGFITDEYRDEMIRAVIAYFRTFLPEILQRRSNMNVA